MGDRYITISGKRWRLKYTKLRGRWGECDAPETKHKEIRIAKGVRRYKRMHAYTLIHEALHASLWPLSEEHVHELASDLARLLEQQVCLKT